MALLVDSDTSRSYTCSHLYCECHRSRQDFKDATVLCHCQTVVPVYNDGISKLNHHNQIQLNYTLWNHCESFKQEPQFNFYFALFLNVCDSYFKFHNFCHWGCQLLEILKPLNRILTHDQLQVKSWHCWVNIRETALLLLTLSHIIIIIRKEQSVALVGLYTRKIVDHSLTLNRTKSTKLFYQVYCMKQSCLCLLFALSEFLAISVLMRSALYLYFQTEAETERLLLTEEFQRMFLLFTTVCVYVVACWTDWESACLDGFHLTEMGNVMIDVRLLGWPE